MPNLTAFGATEYMDGALTLNVLKELFLRGTPSHGRGRSSRTRGSALTDFNDIEEEDRERRSECRDLLALDLTGCVSAVFVNALTEFVTAYLLPSTDSSSMNEDLLGDSIQTNIAADEPLVLPGLKRLGLRGVKSILPRILTPFVLAFPSLTHLDLSGTRVTPNLLAALGNSPTVRLHSLALARCTRLTSESIKNFLVYSPVAATIVELSLYGDMTFTSPLSEDDLREILAFAPCFTDGNMVYLDLSSTPLTNELLLDICKPQLKLRSLGISYIPNLELKVIADFLRTKAHHVEILTLVGTSPELDCRVRPGATLRHCSIALHTQIIRPLCTPPFTFNLSSPSSPLPPPTRLRVIELATPMLAGLGVGAGSWRIVRSKGGRGWYVDTASGWVTTPSSVDGMMTAHDGNELRRDLDLDHPLRQEMERWANANGNVSSGVGWHARKMEVGFSFSFFSSLRSFTDPRSCMASECLGERMACTVLFRLLTKAER